MDDETREGLREIAANAAEYREELQKQVAAETEKIARRFHEAYERLAPEFGYETRKASAVPWEQVPEQNRKLMVAVVGEVLGGTAAELAEAERLLAQAEGHKERRLQDWNAEVEQLRVRQRTLVNALRYIRGDDVPGYPHMSPQEVAGAVLASLNVPVGEREIAEERLREWHDQSVPIIAALAIYGEGANISALVQKAQALNEHGKL